MHVSGEQRRPGRMGAPGRSGPLGGAAAALRIRVTRPDSTAASSRSAGAGLPVTAAATRSRTRATRACTPRISSPVPTSSCHRASTSPRRSAPSRTPRSTTVSASRYAPHKAVVSVCATVTCWSAAPASRPTAGPMAAMAPSTV